MIAAQGFEATTVRQIAQAAEVTERTFYRYFDGKEGLVADEANRWTGRLCDQIAARPADEPPLASVRAALLALARELGNGQQPEFVWLLTDQGTAVAALRRSGAKPLLRLEAQIAEALGARGGDGGAGDGGADPFVLALAGRVSAALLRSIMIERRQQLGAGTQLSLGTGELIERAFTTLPEALGVSPEALGVSPEALGVSPEALGVSPGGLGVSPGGLG